MGTIDETVPLLFDHQLARRCLLEVLTAEGEFHIRVLGEAETDGRGNGSGGDPRIGYPPEGDFYHHPSDPESRYLWRWICFQAPDLVLELVNSNETRWEANEAARRLAPAVAARSMWGDGTLLNALGTGMPNNLGPIPGLRLEAPSPRMGPELGRLWGFIAQFPSWEPSPARRALDSRRSRSRLRIASILDSVYGHGLDPVNYTQGVGISGQLVKHRLVACLEGEVDELDGGVQALVEPTPGFYGPLEPGELAHGGLRLLRVVPKAGFARQRF